MPRNYRSLKSLKIRPDWNKYTLYALAKLRPERLSLRTFFQQKWRAKSLARAYHSPYVREGKWERMFTRRFNAVVPMNYKYLARTDGSELASGRGAGLVTEQNGEITEAQGQTAVKDIRRTPYMGMTFYPLERRLDTAIWRALFASSTKQARQMVIHGSVKVNGKKMRHAGYLLNPGDMFQVEPDKVLYATGARKKAKDSPIAWNYAGGKIHPLARQSGQQIEDDTWEDLLDDLDEGKPKQEALNTETSEEATDAPTAVVAETEVVKTEAAEAEDTEADSTAQLNKARSAFKQLRLKAKEIIREGRSELSGKRLAQLRGFSRAVQTAMSKFGRKSTEGEEAQLGVAEFEQLFADLSKDIPDSALPTADSSARKVVLQQAEEDSKNAKADAEAMVAALARARENPIDASKPYATPWRPRPFMSAFAFIPRYLEVNQTICSAVYLRHPVARPGLAEVPTPFEPDLQQLAFNWYLRRR